MPASPANWNVCGVVFLAALVLNLAGLWSIPLTDRDEAYYAEVSREMLERGDFLLPHFNEKRWLE
jgi:4-amino-4-deoxy-L-arabinose transferase-like glycosyltransferase